MVQYRYNIENVSNIQFKGLENEPTRPTTIFQNRS